ncbi:hypothetical protein B0H14DRAFT_2598794 [Mycena olivaceomarginata]|nr:hypothetical protein B0H14DRAFT_2598794 [Mycena olivaceomarginata]
MDEYIPASIETPEQLKHYKHAEAQRRYREKNLEKTREKARQRMQLSSHKATVYDPELPAQQNLWQWPPRNAMPATLTIVNRKKLSPSIEPTFLSNVIHPRFSLRKRRVSWPFVFYPTHCRTIDRKFVAKFGEDAFFDFYLPQHNLRGAEHLPGIAVEYSQLQKHDRVKEKGGGRAAKAPTL